MKKKRLLATLASLVVLGGTVGLVVGCDRDEETPVNPNGDTNVPVTEFTVGLSSSKNISIGETITVVPTVVSPSNASDGLFTYQSSATEVAYVDDNGKITGMGKGTAIITVTCGNFEGDEGDEVKTVSVTVDGEAEYATGAYTYAGLDYEDSLEILGKLEEYAINNNLTGITLFESGGYYMYDERIEKGANSYISGYGFGVLSEGSFTAANENYEDEGTEWYFHQYYGTTNSENFNYLDDTGSVSSTLYDYVANTYYDVRMNSTKDGYEWYPQLAIEFPSTDPNYNNLNLTETQLNRPVALNKNETTGLATQYRIYLKTGYEWNGGEYREDSEHIDENGLLYHTSSESANKQFDGTPVSIEDYVTPYMALLNGSIGLNRSTDMISDSSDGTLKGARAYYNATSNNDDISEDGSARNLFFSLVSLDIGLDGDPSTPDAPCITVTLNKPLSEFDAMYALSTTLVSPIPIEFIEEIGDGDITAAFKNNYGITNTSKGTSPRDNLLSVGPYILDYSDSTEILYSRNDDYVEKFEEGRYDDSIEGLNLHFLEAMSTDVNAEFREFLAGNLDAASIPQDYLDEYRDDPRTTITQGSSTFKLNVNSCDEDEWEAIFGSDGDNYNGGEPYSVNPLMSNDKFIQALSYAIDRETFANNRGNVPSQDYFADAYMWEPEQGYSYNDTDQHIGNLADRSPDTYGYNFDVAVALMDEAITEEVEQKGSYDGYLDYTTSEYGGTNRENNDQGVIEISWMNTTDAREYGDEIIGYWEEVFEATDAYRKGFRIAFTQDGGSSDYQEVYDTMTAGKFDLGFGSISGMTLDPLGFMEVLQSNNDSGFTLNYSGDTDIIDESDGKVIYYDGKKWSYDGLWEAANNGAIIGSDYQLVENPISINIGGTGIEERNGVDHVRIRLTYVKATEAYGAEMRITTEEGVNDETFTVSGTYTVGTDTETVTFNLSLSDYAVLDSNANLYNELQNTEAGGSINLYIPLTLSTDLTYLDSEIQANQLTSVYIYLNIYTTYFSNNDDQEGYTISSSYTVGTISMPSS